MLSIHRHSFQYFAAITILGSALTARAPGQEPGRSVEGPVLGYVYQPGEGIRPVYGIPGAAALAPAPVVPAEAIRNAVVAPVGGHALIVLSESGQVAAVSNLSGPPRVRILDVQAGPARIVFSPDGSAAALYYKEPARLEVLTGLPEAPFTAWTWDLSSLPGELGAVALGPAGKLALVAINTQPTPVWLVSPEEGQRWIHLCEGAPSLAFLDDGGSALIADGGTGEVWMARDLAQQPALERIAGPDEGVSQPVAAAASRDGRRIYVAAGDPAGVIVLSLAGEEPLRLSCPCTPRTLERMAGGAAFLLTADGGESRVWMLDDSSSPPRILFVPDAARRQRAISAPAQTPRRTGGVR